MSRALVVYSALCVSASLVYAKHFGNGVWESLSITKCEEQKHNIKFNITLMKMNDTHDGIKGDIVLDEDFDETFGVRLEISKIVDGSCKQSQVIIDDSLIDFFNRYAKDSVADCFKAAGLDPLKMPIPKGKYDIENYVFNNEPTKGMFGTFNLKAYVLQGDDDVGCIGALMEFKEIKTEEEEDEEKEEEK